MASSRVGAMTSASGSPAGASRSASPRISGAKAGPKATVFHDPVWAETIKSRPAASGSSTACWKDVKEVYQRAASASPSEDGRWRSEEQTHELQSIMRITYTDFWWKKKTT